MDIESYLLGKKASGGGGGDTHDWTQIGYESKPTALNTVDDEAFNKALAIKQKVDNMANNSSAKISNTVKDYKETFTIFPNCDTSRFSNSTSLLLTAFASCYSLREVPKIIINNKITSLKQMFQGCYNLTLVDLSGIDSQNVTDMNGLFQNCISLKNVNVSVLNFGKTTDISNMFYGDKELTNINISNVEAPNNTKLTSTFQNCSKLTTLDISLLNTKKVTNCNATFYGCSSLTHITFGANFELPLATNLSTMFYDTNLDNETLNNILAILKTATQCPTKTLSYVGFSQAQATVCQTLSNWSELASAGWTTGY